jgi:hypothetical protein
MLAFLAALSVTIASASAHGASHAIRTRSDYDGRPARHATVGETLAWIPRVVLFPLYVVSEYGLRIPLGWTVTNLERARVPERVDRVIHPLHGLTIAPTLFIDLGLLQAGRSLVPTGGLYFAWNEALHPDNSIRIHASTGGPGFWYFAFTDRIEIAPRSLWSFRAVYLERSDWQYFGLGPDSRQSDGESFNWSRGDVGTSMTFGAWSHATIELATGIYVDHFGTPSIASSTAPTVSGMSAYGRARAFLDSRPIHRPDTSGVRVGGAIEYGGELDQHPSQRWISYRAEGSLFLEVMSPGRAIELHAMTAFADSLTQDPVPLVQLVALGGMESMRGWYVGRFRGESAVVASASYRYPIWHSLDGAMFAEAGNVFGHHLEGFDVARMHGSFGIGVRSTGSRDTSFDVLIAAGTSAFDQPFAFENVRFAVGVNGDP